MDEPPGVPVPTLRMNRESLRRRVGIAVTVVALAAIALATLRHGDPAVMEPHGHWCLVCGSQGTVDVIQNVALYAPLGAGLALMGVPLAVALLVAAAASMTAELLQATVFIGRAATLSDVLTNTAGAVLAFTATRNFRLWLAPSPRTARWLAGAWGASWIAALVLSAWSLQPDTPPGPYPTMQLAPESGATRAFEGVILEAYAGGTPVAPGVAPPDGPIARALREEPLDVRGLVKPMSYAPGMYRPIVSVLTEDWRSVTSLGQRHEHLVFSRRLNSARLRLRSPSVRLYDVFPGTYERGARRNEPIQVSAEYSRPEILLMSRSAVETRTTTVRITPLHGWVLLLPRHLDQGMATLGFGALWFAGWMLPLGYWSACAVRSAGSLPRSRPGKRLASRTTAGLAIAIALACAMAPWPLASIAALSTPAPAYLVAGCAALAAGAALAITRLASE